MSVAHQLREKVFQQIHGNNLVYNTCWEDPRCDRALLQLNAESKVVMLTSAGCNALDYLLDKPAQVHCVDLNPRQNALLELKKAFFAADAPAQLFDFFGAGGTPHFREIYFDSIRPALPQDSYARAWWDQKISNFSAQGLRRSFYWHGSSGTAAWLVHQWFKSRPQARRVTRRLFESETLAEQWVWYQQLEPKFLNPFMRWAMQQHLVQSLLGVPKSQQALASQRYPDGIAGYIRDCLRQVFTERPLRDNYFWKLYFFGRYTPDCCPNYLRSEYFDEIRAQMDRITTYSTSLNGFLRHFPGQYTHFILLDHQDWLATHLREALEEEWELILRNAAPGAKILLRTAAPDLQFLPQRAQQRVHWDRAAAAAQHRVDRVGTYAGTWIGNIQD